MSDDFYFSIDQTPEGYFQLSINCRGVGYRICGPKYDGRSKNVSKHAITDWDIKVIRGYLNRLARQKRLREMTK